MNWNWMGLVVGFLEFIMVMDCLVLVLLILVQLPKKEAGMGTAFGGGATDALFGAGSGNVLTQLTKYTAGIFIGLSLVLSVMIMNQSKSGTTSVERALKRKSATVALPPVPVANAAPSNNLPAAVGSMSNAITLNLTNAVKAAVPTNVPAK